ncbi:MAG: lysoplasmalogenase family protein [Clostridiales bacterium]|jgi:hypothetical protein|nr:lysoplasmalogenase family protein [Clostridiales bacterium]
MPEKLFFCFVLLCFFISLKKRAWEDKRDAFLLRLAMAATVMADFMMIVAGNNKAGLVFFCIAQLVYAVRFKGIKKAAKTFVLAALVFGVSALAAFRFMPYFYAEAHMALFYAVCILSAVSGSFAAYKKRPSRKKAIAFSGMALFLLCDINVALFNLFHGIVFRVMIWVFYLPSQILLSLSAQTRNE